MFFPSSDQLNLLLIDPDPQFGQKFAADLNNEDTGLRVVLEVNSAKAALEALQQWFASSPAPPEQGVSLDLVLLSLELPPVGMTAIELCQELRRQYPALPILTMSWEATPALVAAAFRAGAMGYCRKDTPRQDWVAALRQVAAGMPFWVQGMAALGRVEMASGAAMGTIEPVNSSKGAIGRLRSQLRQSGLAQIDAAIAAINEELKHPRLSAIDQTILMGQRRELRASRWLVNWLLASSKKPKAATSVATPIVPSQNISGMAMAMSQPDARSPLVPQPETKAIRSIQASLFDTTFAKLQFNLRNLTDVPLEIDILRDDRKRELLTIVLRKLEELLAELRSSQVDGMQIQERRDVILLDLWLAAMNEFFGRYTTLAAVDPLTNSVDMVSVPMVEVLVQDGAIVEADILSKIPLVSEFLAHLLYQVPLMVDEISYALGTVEAMTRMEALLQNLMIQVANAVMQPLLNRFGNVVEVKQNFYDRRLLSTREIERFRNNLSWKYRVQRYVKEPIAIFESRYMLFVLAELGIGQTSIYSPRSQELDRLTGVGLAVTLVVEARDAIAPRLRSAVSFIGSGVVYILTEVIGRGIGLIGRGIIKGVGNVIQDPKFNRDGQR